MSNVERSKSKNHLNCAIRFCGLRPHHVNGYWRGTAVQRAKLNHRTALQAPASEQSTRITAGPYPAPSALHRLGATAGLCRHRRGLGEGNQKDKVNASAHIVPAGLLMTMLRYTEIAVCAP